MNPPKCECHDCTQFRANTVIGAVHASAEEQKRFQDGFPGPTIYPDTVIAVIEAERERCACVADRMVNEWKSYPEGTVCLEIGARIRGLLRERLPPTHE